MFPSLKIKIIEYPVVLSSLTVTANFDKAVKLQFPDLLCNKESNSFIIAPLFVIIMMDCYVWTFWKN